MPLPGISVVVARGAGEAPGRIVLERPVSVVAGLAEQLRPARRPPERIVAEVGPRIPRVMGSRDDDIQSHREIANARCEAS